MMKSGTRGGSSVSICRICDAAPQCGSLEKLLSGDSKDTFRRICDRFASAGREAQRLWISIVATRLCVDMPSNPSFDARARRAFCIQGWIELSMREDADDSNGRPTTTCCVPTLPSPALGMMIFGLSCALAKQSPITTAAVELSRSPHLAHRAPYLVAFESSGVSARGSGRILRIARRCVPRGCSQAIKEGSDDYESAFVQLAFDATVVRERISSPLERGGAI